MYLEKQTKNSLLFVENSFDQFESFFHFEELQVRSEQHEWKIKPHKHNELVQIFIVTEGGGTAQLDDKTFKIQAPFAIYIPDNVVHSFEWNVGSVGFVLSISSSAIGHLAQTIGITQFVSNAETMPLDTASLNFISQLCNALSREQQHSLSLQSAMYMGLLQTLLIALFRVRPNVDTQQTVLSKSEHKLAKFKKLIALNAIEQHQVSWYAKEIGVSSAHLNQICQRHAQSTALSLIHKYLLDEAKRLLIFADLRITTISDRLGFQDNTYFTKFFKKMTGYTPSGYRQNFRQ